MTEDPSLFDAPFFNMTGDEAAVCQWPKIPPILMYL